jgi:hypothetical protein
MKSIEAASTFDSYSARARIYPGLLVVLPLTMLSVLFPKSGAVAALVPILVSSGVLFLVANIVRRRGRRVEERLVARWGGLPTTRMLRFREPHRGVTLERRRSALAAIHGSPLPTRRQEGADPVGADHVYVAATRSLIGVVRAHPGQFPLVEQENAAYGFARNMLGVKPIALPIVVLSLVIDIAAALTQPLIPVLIVGSIHLALASVWLAFVRPGWVKQAANDYAERLFQILDQPPAASSSTVTSSAS